MIEKTFPAIDLSTVDTAAMLEELGRRVPLGMLARCLLEQERWEVDGCPPEGVNRALVVPLEEIGHCLRYR